MSFTSIKIVDTDINLSNKDKENCILFKTSNNSNRLAVFEQLQSLVLIKKTKSNFAANKTSATIDFTTKNKIREIFGEPNYKIGNSSFIYTLNPQKGCKAIFEFNNTDIVTYVGIKDCD